MKKRWTVFAAVAVGTIAVRLASDRWETAYATLYSSSVSPDGCIRVDIYEPFWVLPSVFHEIPDPDPMVRNRLGVPWDAAIFKRAYVASTGEFLGETVVFDPSTVANLTDWGDTSTTGRRVVVANQFPLLDSGQCSDRATLDKLEAYYQKRRELNRPTVEAWRKVGSKENSSDDRSGPSS